MYPLRPLAAGSFRSPFAWYSHNGQFEKRIKMLYNDVNPSVVRPYVDNWAITTQF